MVDKKSPSPLSHTFTDYSSSCTLHGFSYLTVPSKCDRFVWFIFILLTLSFALISSYLAYSDWCSQPVITSLKTTNRDITTLPYPAVTVCSQGYDMSQLTEALERDFEKWLKEKGITRKRRTAVDDTVENKGTSSPARGKRSSKSKEALKEEYYKVTNKAWLYYSFI